MLLVLYVTVTDKQPTETFYQMKPSFPAKQSLMLKTWTTYDAAAEALRWRQQTAGAIVFAVRTPALDGDQPTV